MKFNFLFFYFIYSSYFSWGKENPLSSSSFIASDYSANSNSVIGSSQLGMVVDENYILKSSDVIQVSVFLEPI